MRVLIATSQVPFIRGGAEILAEQLQKALIEHGHEAEIVAIPFKWYPPERILDHMLACRLLDLTESCGIPVDRVIGLKFPAYLIPHPNKVFWLVHQQRQAYDLWDNPLGDLRTAPNGVQVRDAIRHADTTIIPQARAIYTIAANVSKRLLDYCQIESTPLYNPPQDAEKFYSADDHGYIFFPSRLATLKRQSLVLQALALTREPGQLRFAGTPDTPAFGRELKELAHKLKMENRVQWLGHISEEEKRRQYAYSRGVVFPPVDEDYGYITLEAMLSAKPVITCSDSGGPLEFVQDRKTGIVTEPDPVSLAAALDELWSNPAYAKSMGEAGRARYESLGISWSNVVERLLA